MADEERHSVHLLTGAYAVDAMDPQERAAYEEHLVTCATCTAEVRELQAAAAQLGAVDPVEPPERMRTAVLAAAAVTPQEPAGPVHRDAQVVPLRPRRTAAVVVGVAAGLLAVLAVGLGVLLAQARADRAAAMADAQQVSAVLTAPDARTVPGQVSTGGRAAVVVSASEQAAVLVASDLAEPGSGHVYELWFIDPAGKATPAGTFTPGPAGSAAQPLQGSPAGAAVVGLTVEPSGGSAQPTTKPVLAVPLTS